MIHNPTYYGAIPDGKTVCTHALQRTIDECSAKGGGQVLLSGGTYVSGTLFLKHDVEIVIDSSAVLRASPDISDYAENVHCNRYVNEKDMDRCFLFAEDAENITITGRGMIDGNAEAFPNKGSIYRPMMLRFLRCKNVVLSGLRLYDAAAWTTAFLDSENIRVTDVDISNEKRYNGDGLDFDGCRNVFVRGCKIKGTDDNLCLQSSGLPMENVHISDCMFTSICAGIRIGLKSIGNIGNVVISNCIFKDIWREGIKIECTEGGRIHDIVVSNLMMENVRRPIFVLLNNRLADIGSSVGLTGMPHIGEAENLFFSNVIVRDTDEMKRTHKRFQNDIMGRPQFAGIRIDANRNHPIRNLSIDGLSYHFIGGVKKEDIPEEYPEVLDLTVEKPACHNGVDFISENYYPDWSRTAFMDIRGVDGLQLSGIRLWLMNPDERPAYLIENCSILKEEVWNRI